MKITDVKVTGLSYRLEKPIYSAYHYIPTRDCIIVEVFTDEGLVGIGEAGYAGGPVQSTMAVLEKELAPMVIGEDPQAIEKIWNKIYLTSIAHGRRGIIMHAISGLDIALWDLAGKIAGMPTYRLLGYFRDKVPAYASGGFYSEGKGVTELAAEASSGVAEGFKAFKMKIGRLPSIKDDMKRVQAVRDALGPDIGLMVDANSIWDVPTALKWIKPLEELDVRWIEEPVCVDDVEGSARIAAATSIPIAGYEQESNRLGFRDLILHGGVQFVQPNSVRVGGISEVRKIAALAAMWHRPCYPHSFSSAVCILANLHVLASIPNGGELEYDRNPNPLREELNIHKLEIEDGVVKLPERPGLGIELNPDTVEKYRARM